MRRRKMIGESRPSLRSPRTPWMGAATGSAATEKARKMAKEARRGRNGTVTGFSLFAQGQLDQRGCKVSYSDEETRRPRGYMKGWGNRSNGRSSVTSDMDSLYKSARAGSSSPSASGARARADETKALTLDRLMKCGRSRSVQCKTRAAMPCLSTRHRRSGRTRRGC